MSYRICATLLLLAPLGASELQAQACFRGKPAPQCDSFWITEAGYTHNLIATSNMDNQTQVHYLSGELGWMVNGSGGWAYGGTAWFGFLADFNIEPRFGVKARVRRWLSQDLSLDISPGLLVTGQSGSDGVVLGFTGHVGLSVADKVIFLTQVEFVDRAYADDFAWYLGFRLGSQPAVLATTAVGAAMGLACAAMCGW
jgi:hypothetical protein